MGTTAESRRVAHAARSTSIPVPIPFRRRDAPTECDARCGVVFVSFYERCAQLLGVFHGSEMAAYTQLEQTCSEEMPAEPLLRLLGRCTTHDADVAGCQAKLTEGATSCFIYLQEDAPTLGTIGVEAEHLIEVHGLRLCCGEPLLQLQAD